MAAPAGGATTAPVGGGGLNDPVPADLQRLAEALLADFKGSLGQIRPREEVTGWATESGPWGSVQRPPDWRVTKKSDYFMDLADARGLTQLAFHTMVTFDGSPTFDEMASVILSKHTGSTQVVSLGAAARQSLPFPMTDDSGVSQLWCLRWLHPEGGKMWGGLTVTVPARPPAPIPGIEVPGLKTTCTYTSTSCPEAEAVAAHKTVFTPMLKSFWFPKGGGGNDSDGDGVNDNRDPAPFDPRVRRPRRRRTANAGAGETPWLPGTTRRSACRAGSHGRLPLPLTPLRAPVVWARQGEGTGVRTPFRATAVCRSPSSRRPRSLRA